LNLPEEEEEEEKVVEKKQAKKSNVLDYDCDEIIAKEKARKAAAKKSAKKPEVKKSVNAVEKTTQSIKKKYKEGDLTKAQIESLISELTASINELKQLLKTAK